MPPARSRPSPLAQCVGLVVSKPRGGGKTTRSPRFANTNTFQTDSTIFTCVGVAVVRFMRRQNARELILPSDMDGARIGIGIPDHPTPLTGPSGSVSGRGTG